MEKLEKDRLLVNAMEEYGHYLTRLAYAFVKNEGKAEDIVQEVFIPYYINLDTFEGRSSVKTYLYRITVNECRNYFRSWPYRKMELCNLVNNLLAHKQTPEEELLQNLMDVTIPDSPYASLVRSIYVDETKEMIYTDWNGIYSYSVDTNTKEILIDPNEESRIHLFTVNENWLAWEEITTSTLNILNRNSHELLEIPNITIADLRLQDNTLIYMNFSEGN
ncbi:MAG: sigma factor, partial [Psychrobacillus psychrotolerans]